MFFRIMLKYKYNKRYSSFWYLLKNLIALGGIFMKKKVLSIILSALVLASTATMFTGCGKETATPDEVPVMATVDEAPTEVTTEPSEATDPTVSEEVKEAVKDNGLKVNDKGEVVDAKGNKVEVKDGKVEVKTDDGKTVTVKVDEVKEVTHPTQKPTQKATEPKETQKATQSTTKKPATSNTKPATQPTKKPATPKPTPKPTEATKATEAIWHDPVYKTVHHPAETKVVHHDAVTHEEPIYETIGYNVCNQCGKKMYNSAELSHYVDNDSCWSYRGVKEKVQTGTTTVVDKEAYDETVVVKKAWDEEVLVKKGYWEYK